MDEPSAARGSAHGEFALIELLLRELAETTGGAHVAIGPGDDAAVTHAPPGHDLVSTIDSLVEGVHFPLGASAELIGSRAFGVAVSDLAAMGATPSFCIVALTLTAADADWVSGFGRGLAGAARDNRCAIVGGNLARGPLDVAVSAHGYVPAGAALTRSGARPGDVIAVSGDLGGAALALAHPRLLKVQTRAELVSLGRDAPDYPLVRYYLPTPRLMLGERLRGIASAAIDVSDGLLADLGHLVDRSGVEARVDVARLPCALGCPPDRAATAGDDYELLFTCAAPRWHDVARIGAELGMPITQIGTIAAGRGVVVTGLASPGASRGYQHFD